MLDITRPRSLLNVFRRLRENGVRWWFSGLWDGDKLGGFPGSGEMFKHMAKIRLGRNDLCKRDAVA
jgi:hypothetical protein